MPSSTYAIILVLGTGFHQQMANAMRMMKKSKAGNQGTSALTPFDVLQCPGKPVLTTPSMTCSDYEAVADSVTKRLRSLPEQCDANSCPQADFAGCVLRVAGHDFMDFGDGQGGSDGCVDFKDPDNAGLADCLHHSEFSVSLTDAYAEHCTDVSLADFLVIAAEAVMTETRQRVLDKDRNAATINFKTGFKYGRTTAKTCSFAIGRLPEPEDSCSAVKETFVERMGLSWRESAALMGVHTLGRANLSNSGYNGFWSDAENSRLFNNNYYMSILAKGWMPEKLPNHDGKARNQWKRVDEGQHDQATLGKEMMLDTDLCLAYTQDDPGLKELKAAEKQCCTWSSPRFTTAAQNGEFCGSTDIPGASDFGKQRQICCDGIRSRNRDRQKIDCGLPNEPKGPAFDDIREFALRENRWLDTFLQAWRIATSNGFGGLKQLSNCGRRR